MYSPIFYCVLRSYWGALIDDKAICCTAFNGKLLLVKGVIPTDLTGDDKLKFND
jgi:hypothetical protein